MTKTIEHIQDNRTIGTALLERLVGVQLPSLRVSQSLANLQEISYIIFIGSSASGKSTLQQASIRAQKEYAFRSAVSFPRRIVTRESRPDDGEEIVHQTPEEFAVSIQRGRVGLYGIKLMEGGRTEPFGLEQPQGSGLPIYFANNTIVKNPDSIYPQDIFDKALIVGVYAPDAIRERRLRERSPQLFEKSPQEAAFRLSEEERAAIVFRKAQVVVKNFSGEVVNYEDHAPNDVIKLINLVLQLKEEYAFTN